MKGFSVLICLVLAIVLLPASAISITSGMAA
jgi:hypothetical protein